MNSNRALRSLLCAALTVTACGGEMGERTTGAARDTETVSRATTTTFSNPHTGVGVTAIAGRVSSDGHSWLVFWRTTDAHCTWHRLGTPALTSNVAISVENAAFAEVQILFPGQSKGVFCSNFGQSWTFNSSVVQNSFWVVAHGSPGADYFNCSGSGTTVCNGGEGNDHFDSFDADSDLRGDGGNDIIRLWPTPTNLSFLFGGPGVDCLQLGNAPSQPIGGYNCGPDSPDKSNHILGADCEQLVGACN